MVSWRASHGMAESWGVDHMNTSLYGFVIDHIKLELWLRDVGLEEER